MPILRMSTKLFTQATAKINMAIGLTSKEAAELLKKYGPNQLPTKQGVSALRVFIKQINNPFTLLLGAAIILSFVIGDALDGSLILGILVLNISLGFWQEYKTSRELEALRSLEVLYSRVIRDETQQEIPAWQIVPKDLVILEPGDKIPADGTLIESISLQVNESSLTGESLPVVKSISPSDNQVFFGTSVVSGRGKFIVETTAVHTKFGDIAQTLSAVKDEPTPLEISLGRLVKTLVVGVVVIASLFFTITHSFLTSVALMVAAVPEGLPAVVTVVLALGARKMYQKKALIRRMVAVESLGAATLIATDKTGTLTKNEMRVQQVETEAKDDLIRCASVCNSASLVLKEDGGGYDILGDTTEGALLLWAKEEGIDIELLRSQGKLMEEIPFSLQTRMMTVVWQAGQKKTTYTKGAPEVILSQSDLSEKEIITWTKKYQKMAQLGLRVLGFAKGEKFLGIIGIADDVRKEAKEAIAKASAAGIRVVMVTGDNEITAKAVAEKIGLLKEGEEVLTGAQLRKLTDEEVKGRLNKVRIFARIEPEQKHRIVKLYQDMGEVVAVTGDGVNDCLALKQAQVGVSMGITGTDVAKETSDIVLLDDNFATLVSAVEQGRLIYSNILKVIKFLLTGNLSEILLITLAVILGLPIPLLPTQILWINFVTDGLPALALGFDTASPNLMRIPPQSRSSFLAAGMIRYIATGGVIISIICLLVFYIVYTSWGLELARSYTFTLMVMLQMILPFIIRRHHSILSNKRLFASVVLVLLVQAVILLLPQF